MTVVSISGSRTNTHATDATPQANSKQPHDELRMHVRRAVQAIVGDDLKTHERLLRQSQAAAEPVANELVALLEARAAPEGDADFSLLAAIPVMAAFGDLITGYAYRRAASAETSKLDVRRCMAMFVVASAIFDHACDEQPELLTDLENLVTPDWVRKAVAGRAPGDPLAEIAGANMVAYLGVLLAETARTWAQLAPLNGTAATLNLRDALIDGLRDAYRAELRSCRREHAAIPVRDARRIWASPLCTALRLVAITPDAAPGVDLPELIPEAMRIGWLLSLIDDVVDLRQDWRSGSANQYLERAGVAFSAETLEMPWPLLLAAGVREPFVDEIAELLKLIPDESERAVLGAWILYWLNW
jgi:hypothetical protein